MADDLEPLFGRTDAPRALPAELRARLSDVLLAEVAARPEPEDALAPQLGDVDAERPLSPALRGRLQTGLQDATRSAAHRRRRAALLGVAASLVAVVGAGVAVTAVSLSDSSGPGRVADPRPVVRHSHSPSTERPPVSAGVGAPRPGPSGVGGAASGGQPVLDSLNDDQLLRRAQKRYGWFSAAIPQRASAEKHTSMLLAQVSPAFGGTDGGTRVVIRSAGVGGVRDVRFGGVRATWVDARSNSRVVAVTPAVDATGRVDITLRGPGIFLRIPDGYSYAFVGIGTWF